MWERPRIIQEDKAKEGQESLGERTIDEKHGIRGEYSQEKISLQVSELTATAAILSVHGNLLHSTLPR